ncbi:MAG: hypothetical protein HZT43_10890 [Exiguobacterium profundum]|nr:MAG: hypothetical protein HZT43_10890 [Exiguobacterium profundum]
MINEAFGAGKVSIGDFTPGEDCLVFESARAMTAAEAWAEFRAHARNGEGA